MDELNRHYLLATASKLLCRECDAVSLIVDYFSNGEALLSCGHRRPAGLLARVEHEEVDAEERIDDDESGTESARDAEQEFDEQAEADEVQEETGR